MGVAEKISEVDERGFLVDLQDLKRSYRKTLGGLIKWRKSIEVEIEQGTSMTIEQFYDRKNKKYRDAWKKSNADLPNELEAIKGMISDVNFAIEWLHTGRHPGNRRGIDRRSVYQNTVLMDPMIMANFSNAYNSRSSTTLTFEENDRLRDALEILSVQERQCYTLAYGYGIPHEQIAAEMGLSKGTVSTYIKRAHEKVSRGWQTTLF